MTSKLFLSLLWLPLLLSLLLPGRAAAELAVQPYQAVYAIYKADSKIGESELRLQHTNNLIRWQLSSKATGLYSILTSKKPYSETALRKISNEYRMSSVLVSKDGRDDAEEMAEFDWANHTVDFRRKKKTGKLPLTNPVYDNLSIHWLSAQMTLDAKTSLTFDFYRKARLRKSTLTFVELADLEILGERKTVILYKQTFAESSSQMLYFYDVDNFLLPLKIERTEPGEDSSTLLFTGLKKSE